MKVMPVNTPEITFCIFGFNRGQFLQHCVASIEKALPAAEIVLFDDDSTDPATCDILAHLQARHQVIKPVRKGAIKHGGLYHNMQNALELLSDRRLLCFLQDDTQVVRPLGEKEISQLHQAFADHPQLGFIHPCFIRGVDLRKRPVIALPGPEDGLYLRKDMGQSAGVHYSDLVIFNPRRLLDAGWRFAQSEPENDRQAKALFGAMPYMHAPFAMWLPEVPAYRGKQKTFALKVAERKRRCGFYPFVFWREDQVASFLQRPRTQLPVAEDFLTCEPSPAHTPWTYNPLTGQRLLKHLNNLEVFLRRYLRIKN